MSRRKNNRNNQNERAEPEPDPILKLNVYYVRMHDTKHELVLVMNFDDGTTIPFNNIERICKTNSLGPFFYVTDFEVRMGQGKVHFQLENGQKPLGSYRLEMSYFGSIRGQQKIKELGDENHSLKYDFNQQHYFHFGIRFSSKFNFFVPGRSSENKQHR